MESKNRGRGLMKGFFLVCIGGVLIAIGLSLGGEMSKNFKFVPGNDDDFEFSWNFSSSTDDEEIHPVDILEGTIPAGIRNIAVDLNTATLDISYGTVPGYRATDFKEDSIVITVEDDTLTVNETGWQHTFNFWKNHQKRHLEIILPEGMTLDTGIISIGTGSLNMENINADKIHIESGVGSIKGEDIRASRISLKTGAGSLDFTDCSFGDTVIETGTGRVQFDGELTSRAAISTGAGSIELRLPGSEDDYRVDFTRGIGSVKIGRATYNGIGNGTAGNMDADRRLEISTGVGSVRIRFDE